MRVAVVHLCFVNVLLAFALPAAGDVVNPDAPACGAAGMARASLPRAARPAATIDPAKTDWKIVFADDFDGAAGAPPDPAKWFIPPWRRVGRNLVACDGAGHLALAADFAPGTTNLISTALWSVPNFCYGYFEARVRFTRNNGWWAAFWLYGDTNRNAFEDGSEIDIFEDYYTRLRRGRLPGQIELDHNLHMSYGPTLKSDKRTSAFAGDMDAFHTVGCRWSPLGVAFYVDGQLQTNSIARAQEQTAFFDAFAAGAIRTPLHVILSGQIFKTWGARDLTGMVFPEYYLIDWVRVWRCPEDAAGPHLNWCATPQELAVCAPGTECTLEVVANPADEIECAWLFDGGAYLAARTAPPWRFTVPFSQAGFAATQWGVPGRQGAVPTWDACLHSFAVYARDRQGRIGVTSVPYRVIAETALTNAPALTVEACGKGAWTFRPASGRISALMTGDTRHAAFTAEKGGRVTGRVRYHAGKTHPSRLWLLVDGHCVAVADCPPAADGSWRTRCVSPDFTFDLAPGAHTLALVALGQVVLETLTLQTD